MVLKEHSVKLNVLLAPGVPLQIPNFLMSQVRKLNENSNRRYQFYDRRIKNLLRKIHTDSREKPDKNSSEVRARDPAAQARWDLGKKHKSKECEILSVPLSFLPSAGPDG